MADRRPGPAVTVQVVQAPDPSARRTSRIGIGLLVSLVAGWPALEAALSGDGFEAAVVRFLLAVALSVGAALGLGSLYDHFTSEAPDGDADGAGDHTTATGLPVGKERSP